MDKNNDENLGKTYVPTNKIEVILRFKALVYREVWLNNSRSINLYVYVTYR